MRVDPLAQALEQKSDSTVLNAPTALGSRAGPRPSRDGRLGHVLAPQRSFHLLASLMHTPTLLRIGKATSSVASHSPGFPYYGHVAVLPTPATLLSCSRAMHFVCVWGRE